MQKFLVAAAFALGAALAQAQTSAPVPPSAPPPDIPKPTCTKPDYPGNLASDYQMRSFNRDVKDYTDCMKRYASAQGAIAEAHTRAANAAIDEYNAFVKDVQAQRADIK